jgi:hypothetical protein
MGRVDTMDERYFSKGEPWKQIEPDKWFNPDFQNFLNTEVVAGK